MEPSGPLPSRRRSRLPRAGLVAGALAVALALVATDCARRRGHDELLALATSLGFDATPKRPGSRPLGERLRDEESLPRARLTLARALLAHELDARRWRALPAEEAAAESARSEERLAAAERLATAALAALPASWEAPYLLGGARLVGLLGRRDVRLVRAPERWEAPLALARERGPVFREPSQLLAAAYLEIWPMLSLAAQGRARTVLGEAFADPATFDRFFPAWARIARTPHELAQPLPDRAGVWNRVASHYAAQADWPHWLEAHDRATRARTQEIEELLAESRARQRGGDRAGAAAAAVQAGALTRPGRAEAPLFDQAVRSRPAGAPAPALAAAARAWLEWAATLAPFAPLPLAPETLERTARGTPGLPPELVAWALAAAGDLPAAELVERRQESQWSEAWGGYLLAKAALLLDRGDPVAAAAALAPLHREWRRRPAALALRLRLARIDPTLAPRGEAEAAFAAAHRDRWEATVWRWRGSAALLELLPATSATGLTLAFDEVPAAGAVVAIQWQGEALVPRAVRPGSELDLPLEIAAAPGLLRVESLAGGRVRPGRVTLR